MRMHRPRVAKVLAVGLVLAVGSGVAVATAEDLPASPPSIYRGTTGVTGFAASSGADGTGVTVAVIDTGVADLPEFDGKVIHQQNISSAPDEGDQYGHGTFVAGLVHRVAPGAEIVSIKLSDANGAVDVTQVLAALQWVALNRTKYSIDVVNLSFGNDSKQSAYTSPLNFAVQQLWDQGIVVVASAGNLGGAAGTVTKPADDPLIISVGASDELGTSTRDDDSVPTFVSRGPTQDGLAKPDLVAPGTRVISLRAPGSTVDVANPQARVGTSEFRGSGTSFAAPIVAGVIAQVLSADPTLTPDQIKFGVLNGAALISGDPAAVGAGSIRAAKTLHFARQGRANANVRRSVGTGSLDGARGSAKVEVETLVSSIPGVVERIDVPLTGDHTGETESADGDPALLLDGETPIDTLDDFNEQEFLAKEQWDGSHWGGSHWGSTQWGGSHWGGSHWGASEWSGSHWGSSQWWGSHWG